MVCGQYFVIIGLLARAAVALKADQHLTPHMVKDKDTKEVADDSRHPDFSVKEWVLEHDPKVRAEEQRKEDAKAAHKEASKEAFKKKISGFNFKKFISNNVDRLKTFNKEEAQKHAVARIQHAAERKAMAEEERLKKEFMAIREAKQKQQDQRIMVDETRQQKRRQEIETAQRHNEEHDAQQKIRSEQAELRKKSTAARKIVDLKRHNAKRFKRSTPGKECPNGFETVTTKEDCKLAALVLDGIDEVQLARVYHEHPQGCFWQIQSSHVSFNVGKGDITTKDMRICKKSGR